MQKGNILKDRGGGVKGIRKSKTYQHVMLQTWQLVDGHDLVHARIKTMEIFYFKKLARGEWIMKHNIAVHLHHCRDNCVKHFYPVESWCHTLELSEGVTLGLCNAGLRVRPHQ